MSALPSILADREVSVGNYVLWGGELGAAVIVDAVTRLVPGASGNEASSKQESFTEAVAMLNPELPNSTCGSGGLLDYPHYTRPAEYAGCRSRKKWFPATTTIRRWRRQKALAKTLQQQARSAGTGGVERGRQEVAGADRARAEIGFSIGED